MNKQEMEYLGLKYNPFEPAASGAPVKSNLWIPTGWKNQITPILDTIEAGEGAKAMSIQENMVAARPI